MGRGQNQWGDKNPCWRGGKSKFSCRLCGKEFLAYQSEYDRGGARFCSKSCLWGSTTRRKPAACEHCGNTFEPMRSEVIEGRGRFCSMVCYGAWFSINKAGENNPHFGIKLSPDHCKHIGDAHRGEKHYNWKNGHKMQNGYVFIKVGDGYVQEHRLVAEKALGRKLKRGEEVHHINGDRTDNRNCNLLICDKGYHMGLHRKMALLYQQEYFPPKPDASASA